MWVNFVYTNLKFRRQHSCDKYVLDFYCHQLKLTIEMDGEYHVYNEKHDSLRDEKLDSSGITTFRYENRMVFEHPKLIIDDIKALYQNNN